MPPPADPNKEEDDTAASPSEGKTNPDNGVTPTPATMKRARDTPEAESGSHAGSHAENNTNAHENTDAHDHDRSARSGEMSRSGTAKRMRVPPQIIVYDFSTDQESQDTAPDRSPAHVPVSVLSGDAHTGDTPNRHASSSEDRDATRGASHDSSQDPTPASTRGRGAFLDAVGVSDSTPCTTDLPSPVSPNSAPPPSPQSESESDSSSSSSDDSPRPPTPKVFCEITRPVHTIDDLIAVGKLYEEADYDKKTYSVNVAGLHRMIPALEEFKAMIGMDSIKRQVVDQIIYLSGTKNHSQFCQHMAGSGAATSNRSASATESRKPQFRGTSPLALPPSSTADAAHITHIRPLSHRRPNHTPLRSNTRAKDAPRSTNANRNTTGGGSSSSKSAPASASSASSLLSQLFSGIADAQKSGERKAGSAKPIQFSSSESVTREDTAHDMFHTVIYGPPGVGKTAFAKILARLFLNLGITQNDTFRVARRSDLIGEYVGHTATKTQKVIDEAMGGVLFIDEVYSLGNGAGENKNPGSKSDSFSTECINTLNQNLTERKGEFVCIIAGYKKETEKQFFDLNPGLRRRFSFQYSIDAYDWKELTRILLYKIEQLDGWECVANLGSQLLEDTSFLQAHMPDFPHFAGDVETWLLHIKIAHCKRVFGRHESVQRIITFADVEAGLERYKAQKRDADKERRREQEASMRHLYM